MTMTTNTNTNRFSHFNEDAYRLPEGMQRIAYDADTQRYTFRDRSGQLFQGAPGEAYGVLRPITTPLSHRRNVTITEIHDPALKEWSQKRTSTKTFGDILPSGYITAAQTPTDVESPTSVLSSSSEKFMQAAVPKVQGVVEIVRRRTTMRRSTGPLSRTGSITDEKRKLLEDASWEVVSKDSVTDGRLGRSKSEMRPSRYFLRK